MSDKTEVKTEVKTIRCPKGAVAGFKRAKDGVRIWVYPRTGESTEAAISRVMARNGSQGEAYEKAA